jgi:Cytochrome c oxidase assembly protein CtaG/Cox11
MPPLIKKILLAAGASLMLASPVLLWLYSPQFGDDPLPVLSTYLRFLYARDFGQAYGFISTVDQRIKKRDDYVRERGAFTGFALEAARKLAELIEVRKVSEQLDGQRNRVKVAYRLPAADSVAPLLLGWDEKRLSALPAPEQKKILATIDDLARRKKLPMIEGEEEFTLVKENSQWKVFLNWAAGVKIKFDTIVPSDGTLTAEPITRETIVRSGESFTIGFKVKNQASNEIRTRIAHQIEPVKLKQYLDLVECALLLPVRLRPGEEQVYNSTYLVRGDLPDTTKALDVTYEFKVEP